jgi:hypothetical protein
LDTKSLYGSLPFTRDDLEKRRKMNPITNSICMRDTVKSQFTCRFDVRLMLVAATLSHSPVLLKPYSTPDPDPHD